MREFGDVGGKRVLDCPVHENRDRSPLGLERQSNRYALGEKDPHFHCAALGRAERDRGSQPRMAGFDRGRTHRRATIRAGSGRDHRVHRSLFEEASTRRRVDFARAGRWAHLPNPFAKSIDSIRETVNTPIDACEGSDWSLWANDNPLPCLTAAASQELHLGGNQVKATTAAMTYHRTVPISVGCTRRRHQTQQRGPGRPHNRDTKVASGCEYGCPELRRDRGPLRRRVKPPRKTQLRLRNLSEPRTSHNGGR